VSREWELPPECENGIVADHLRASKHLQTPDRGATHPMALEIGPAREPARDDGTNFYVDFGSP